MKRTVVLSVVAMLCLSVPSLAGVVIGDFEGSLDGWVMESGAVGTVSTEFPTSGSNSLQVVFPNNWISVMKKSITSYATADLETISFDVTTRNDNSQIPAWWLHTNIIINSDVTGWKDSGNLYSSVPWSPRTDTITWTVPQAIRDLLAGGAGWCDVLIVTNTGSTGGTMWIDNVQLGIVPEPATMSLLGLGALALLKRRK
jgi:hypothetical protein